MQNEKKSSGTPEVRWTWTSVLEQERCPCCSGTLVMVTTYTEGVGYHATVECRAGCGYQRTPHGVR